MSPLQPPSTIFSVHYRHHGPYAAEALASKLALWHEETLVTLRNQLFSPPLNWATWVSASNPSLWITSLHVGCLVKNQPVIIFFCGKERKCQEWRKRERTVDVKCLAVFFSPISTLSKRADDKVRSEILVLRGDRLFSKLKKVALTWTCTHQGKLGLIKIGEALLSVMDYWTHWKSGILFYVKFERKTTF